MRLLLSQITRWLTQVAVWRFVGFVSTFVGLLCYALSSSFNYLFGEWNMLKIFLYTLFGLFICLWSLFAKECQRSTSLRFKAHSAFLVLTITSVYSYFADKVVNGKPDAYSLISCVAFAIMSFSLSRQTQCGFEVDLFYFFLGCLIVLLMKINLALAIVGVGFSYSLIILRYYLNTTSHDNLAVQDDNSDSVVIDVNSLSTHNAGNSMMQKLMACMKSFQKDNLNLISMLLERTKEYLEDESKDSELTGMDHNFVMYALPSEKIKDLEETIMLMVSNGFEKECCDEYCNWRKESLEECLTSLFGLQEINIEQEHEGKKLEDFVIGRWIKVVKVAFRILFPSERRLSDRIFVGFSSVADLCFTEVCRGSAIQLLNFADAGAIGSRLPMRLFRILDVFETLRDLIPEFDALFSDQFSVSLRNEVVTIWKRLGEALRGSFMELENLIRQNPAKRVVPGGGLHPITRYVMNYMSAACRSRQSLEQVFEDYGLKDYPKLDDRLPNSSSLSVQMDRIMELLESNLEEKSKIYKDPALCYFFLMNNGAYIVQKTKDSELGTLLGDDWIRKHAAKVRQFHVHYQSSWNKVLGILKLDSNGSLPPNGLAEAMKEKLKSFNAAFEDICRDQSSWFVFDMRLREEIRISLEKILLPAYGNFIARFQGVPELGKHADKYIKFGTEDIQSRLNDLFQGSSGSTGSRK